MSSSDHSPLTYPYSRRVDQVDDYHGTPVSDPYRWLEDLDSAETRKWIVEQNALTEDYLLSLEGRNEIRERITHLWNFEKFGAPFRENGRYFYFRNSGLENQSVLYTMGSLGEEARVLLDPNQLSEDGTLALVVYQPSPDGQLFAYSVSSQGSDWQEIRIRDVENARDLEDRLEWVKFSLISWSRDAKGFFYSRYDEPVSDNVFAGANYRQKLFHHRVGTSQEEDVLVYDDPDEKERGFMGVVSEDGCYLVIHVRLGTETRSRIYVKDLGSGSEVGDRRVVKLLDDFDARYEFVGNDGTEFWIQTDNGAPRGRLIGVNLEHPEPENWREIVSERDATLESVVPVSGGFIASYLEDAHSRLECYARDGTHLRTLPLAGLGTVTEFSGKASETECFYAYTSFTLPPTIYRYDIETGVNEVFRRPEIDIPTDAFETHQAFYESKDGTRVPMFIVHRRGLELDGSRPTLLYGYGGFNISVTPTFAVSRIAWLEMGGVYAVANIRGGGEYGEEWHQSGVGRNKQKGLDDFVAAGEWLIENGYTNRDRLAISGGSNGGMLVGAAMTQRPDLFAATVPAVGVMDLLRFHKFTIGWAWVSDYGSPDDPADFPVLYSCSPYHNLVEGTDYPATLVTTGDHDDRVVPSHSFKFAAALQAAQGGERPALIRIAVSAGHGMGKPTSMQIEEAVDVLTFLKGVLHVV